MRSKNLTRCLVLAVALLPAIAIFLPVKIMAQKAIYKTKMALPPITVQFPRRGSALVVGNTYTLKWTINDETAAEAFRIIVRRDRSTPGGYAKIPHSGDYVKGTSIRWKVPGLESANDYRISFISVDGSKDLGLSDKFSIKTYKPDLIISQISCEEDMAYAKMTIKAWIENDSLGKADPSTAKLEIQGPGTFEKVYDNLPVPSLNYGSRHMLTITYDVPQAGEYTHDLSVDINDDVDESNEQNNGESARCEGHKEQNLCDLIVCRYGLIEALTNRSVEVPVLVKNIGNGKSPRSRVCIWIEKRGKECFDVPELEPDDDYYCKERDEYWTWPGWREYYAEIDPDNLAKEAFENNNKVWGYIVKAGRLSYSGGSAVYHGEWYCSDNPRAGNSSFAHTGVPWERIEPGEGP